MAYLAVQVVCTVILTCGVEVVSTDQTFHRLEFGATFVFALVTTFSLVCSPERDFCSPLLLKFLVFANVGARATRERPGCVGGREWHAGAAVPRRHRRTPLALSLDEMPERRRRCWQSISPRFLQTHATALCAVVA